MTFQLRPEGWVGINQAGQRYPWEESSRQRHKKWESLEYRKREKEREREKPTMMHIGGAERITTQLEQSIRQSWRGKQVRSW